MRKDDSSLPAQQRAAIRNRAEMLLREAGALGRFPTPVADLLRAAQLTVEREVSLDRTFLGRFYKRLPGTIKRAVDKVLGLLDLRERLIYIDRTTHEKRQTFLTLHETAHGCLPWQRDAYALLEDSEGTLDPDVRDLFEREANGFASELLFQLDAFEREAADCGLEIMTPLKLAKRYGSSFYAAARRFVARSHRACAVLVFDGPTYQVGTGYSLSLRRCEQSAKFTQRFGPIQWQENLGPSDFLTRITPVHRKFTQPTRCTLTNLNHEKEECVVEAFDSTFQVFFLLYPVSELKSPQIRPA